MIRTCDLCGLPLDGDDALTIEGLSFHTEHRPGHPEEACSWRLVAAGKLPADWADTALAEAIEWARAVENLP